VLDWLYINRALSLEGLFVGNVRDVLKNIIDTLLALQHLEYKYKLHTSWYSVMDLLRMTNRREKITNRNVSNKAVAFYSRNTLVAGAVYLFHMTYLTEDIDCKLHKLDIVDSQVGVGLINDSAMRVGCGGGK
jgi:hypothetical protein